MVGKGQVPIGDMKKKWSGSSCGRIHQIHRSRPSFSRHEGPSYHNREYLTTRLEWLILWNKRLETAWAETLFPLHLKLLSSLSSTRPNPQTRHPKLIRLSANTVYSVSSQPHPNSSARERARGFKRYRLVKIHLSHIVINNNKNTLKSLSTVTIHLFCTVQNCPTFFQAVHWQPTFFLGKNFFSLAWSINLILLTCKKWSFAFKTRVGVNIVQARSGV